MSTVACLWSSISVVTENYQETSFTYFFIIGSLKAIHPGLLNSF